MKQSRWRVTSGSMRRIVRAGTVYEAFERAVKRWPHPRVLAEIAQVDDLDGTDGRDPEGIYYISCRHALERIGLWQGTAKV